MGELRLRLWLAFSAQLVAGISIFDLKICSDLSLTQLDEVSYS